MRASWGWALTSSEYHAEIKTGLYPVESTYKRHVPLPYEVKWQIKIWFHPGSPWGTSWVSLSTCVKGHLLEHEWLPKKLHWKAFPSMDNGLCRWNISQLTSPPIYLAQYTLRLQVTCNGATIANKWLGRSGWNLKQGSNDPPLLLGWYVNGLQSHSWWSAARRHNWAGEDSSLGEGRKKWYLLIARDMTEPYWHR